MVRTGRHFWLVARGRICTMIAIDAPTCVHASRHGLIHARGHRNHGGHQVFKFILFLHRRVSKFGFVLKNAIIARSHPRILFDHILVNFQVKTARAKRSQLTNNDILRDSLQSILLSEHGPFEQNLNCLFERALSQRPRSINSVNAVTRD